MGYRIGTAALAAALAIGASAAIAEPPPPMGATGMGQPALTGAHDGSYAGLLLGLNANELRSEALPPLADNGYFAGGVLGYGVTVNGLYVGLEFDATLRDVGARVVDGGTTVTMSDRWMGSGRARVGVPIGPALLYGTAGAALQQSSLRAEFGGLEDSAREYVWGFVGGVGAEVMITNTIKIGIEGLHYNWAEQEYELAGERVKIDQTDQLVRARLTFKLN
jgi:opacity protein-like surface antigen